MGLLCIVSLRDRHNAPAAFVLTSARVLDDSLDIEIERPRQLFFDATDLKDHFVAGLRLIELGHGLRWIMLRFPFHGTACFYIRLHSRCSAQPTLC